MLPDDATCLGCGYRLVNLPAERCPECGRRFDPRNPLTFASAVSTALRRRERAEQRRQWVEERRLDELLIVGPLTGLAAAALSAWPGPLLSWRVVVIGFGVAVALDAWRLRPTDRTRRQARAWLPRLGVAVVLLVSLRPLAVLLLLTALPSLPAAEARIDGGIGSYILPSRRLGLLPVDRLERCGHGVHLMKGSPSGNASGGGFFRRDAPGRCRFAEVAVPVGGGWYLKP